MHFSLGEFVYNYSERRDPGWQSEWLEYLDLHVEPSEDVDLLAWWKKHCARFPIWFWLARTYLVIPATSAAAERTFSKSRRVLSRLRLQMTQEHADLLVFLRENLTIVEKLRDSNVEYW
jgi:hypothetical protein